MAGKALKTFALGADGMMVWVVAAPSKKAAIEAFGITAYSMDQYGSECDPDEAEVALSKPGVVFCRPMLRRNLPFVEGALTWKASMRDQWPPSNTKAD